MEKSLVWKPQFNTTTYQSCATCTRTVSYISPPHTALQHTLPRELPYLPIHHTKHFPYHCHNHYNHHNLHTTATTFSPFCVVDSYCFNKLDKVRSAEMLTFLVKTVGVDINHCSYVCYRLVACVRACVRERKINEYILIF